MDDLKYIKKYYGENMMHLCRNKFSTILDEKGKLLNIIKNSFYPTKELYGDLIQNNLVTDFEEFIFNKYNNRSNNYLLDTGKSPFELMSDVDYDLYECKTKDDVMSFISYYNDKEKLCTFNGDRLKSCYVFFAVKKGADKLKRKSFTNPDRQDEYGTSVISFQFSRTTYTLSIKNRYNHTVSNPDATFSNNLENIIPGLTRSFEKYLDHSIEYNKNSDFEIPNYVLFKDMYYKFNHEIHNTYYCTDNIIIDDGRLVEYPKEKYLLVDYYTINLVDKIIYLYDGDISDSFVDEYNNRIDKIYIKKENDNKVITIINKNGSETKLVVNRINKIVEYENKHIKNIEYGFMQHCDNLKKLYLPNVEIIENFCFVSICNIEELNFPLLQSIGNLCFNDCRCLEKINMPNLLEIDNNCFTYCTCLEEINAPKLENINYECFSHVKTLKELYLPNLKYMGAHCFTGSDLLHKLYLPLLEKMNDGCFGDCLSIETINLPKLEVLRDNCFNHVGTVKEINMPSLIIMRANNFKHGIKIEKLYLPNLEFMGYDCFNYFETIDEIDLPKLNTITECCFLHTTINKANVPSLSCKVNRKLNKVLRRQQFRSMPKRAVDRFKKLLRVEEKGKSKTLSR